MNINISSKDISHFYVYHAMFKFIKQGNVLIIESDINISYYHNNIFFFGNKLIRTFALKLSTSEVVCITMGKPETRVNV